jgi:hypothetical protein
MRTWHSLFVIFSIISFKAFSQDELYRKDGKVEKVKVIEINKTEIKYNPAQNTDVLKVILKSEVYKIVYENGKVEVFEQDKKDNETSIEKAPGKSFGRSIIALNAFDLLYKQVSLSYEYILGAGYVGVKLPVSVKMFPNNLTYDQSYFGYKTYYSKNKIFSTGAQINFYPAGQGKIKYYLGPAYEYGQFYFLETIYDQNGNNAVIKKRTIPYNAFIVNNGLLISFTDNFSFDFGIGLGASKYTIQNNVVTFTTTRGEARANINFGYRF